MFIRKYSDEYYILEGFGRENLPNPLFFSKNNYFVRKNGEDFLFFTLYFLLDSPIAIIDNFISKKGTSLSDMNNALIVIKNYLKAFFKNIKENSNADILTIKISVNDRLRKVLKNKKDFEHIKDSNSFLWNL